MVRLVSKISQSGSAEVARDPGSWTLCPGIFPWEQRLSYFRSSRCLVFPKKKKKRNNASNPKIWQLKAELLCRSGRWSSPWLPRGGAGVLKIFSSKPLESKEQFQNHSTVPASTYKGISLKSPTFPTKSHRETVIYINFSWPDLPFHSY